MTEAQESEDRAVDPGGASVLLAAQRLPAAPTLVVVVAGVLFVGLLDVAAPDLSLSLLYLLLAAVATASAGPRAGIAVALLTSGVWVAADVMAGIGSVVSRTVNGAVRATLLCLAVWLVHLVLRELEEAARLSRTDHLTGLDNTRALWQRLGVEVARARRDGAPLSLAYLDVDGFKELNDEHGHAAGDRVLRLMGGQLRGRARATDVVARVGGDEFVVVLPATDASAAERVLAEISASVTAATAAQGHPLTLSIGVVTFQRAPRDVAAAVGAADRLMYEVKRAGRGAIRQEIRGDGELPVEQR